MAKSSGLTDIGNILAVVGGILMVIFGILGIVSTVVSSVNNALQQVNIPSYGPNFVRGDALVGSIILLVIGIVLIYIYKEKKARSGDEILIFGIIYIVLGWIAWSLGGILAIIGGILLIIDFFI